MSACTGRATPSTATYRPSLRLKPTDSNAAEYVTYPEDSYNRLEPGFTLGGPIMKDKVWFFVGYNPSFRPYDRTAPFSDGTQGTQHQKLTDQYLAANVTAQLSSQLRARAAYNMSNRKREGTLRRPRTAPAPPRPTSPRTTSTRTPPPR